MNAKLLHILQWGRILSIGVCLTPSGAALGQACNTASIGVDLSQADRFVEPFYCRGWGQVFFAGDTLIRSISVWRPAKPDSDAFARYLFITEADSIAPRTERRLLSAPPIVHQVGDGVHPVEYRWVFDPPFALPHRGLFFFDIMADRWSWFLMPASSQNPYAEGDAWETSSVGGDCPYPGAAYDDPPPRPDLAFQIQFCTAGVVGAPPDGLRPLALSLGPNPFRGVLRASFDLPVGGYVRLGVFDLAGRKVATLMEGDFPPGLHGATWDGGHAEAGMYFVRLEANGQRLSRTAIRIE